MIYLELFWAFFQIGLFTFGGGYAMLPLVQEEVATHEWMSISDLVNFIAVSESTPGPFAVNISTYVGMTVGGLGGAVCATFAVILPSFLVILLVAAFYDRFRCSRIVEGAMMGLRSTVVGLIAASFLSVGQNVFFQEGFVLDAAFWVSVGIFAVVSVLVFRKRHPILLILLSAGVGIVAGYGLGL